MGPGKTTGLCLKQSGEKLSGYFQHTMAKIRSLFRDLGLKLCPAIGIKMASPPFCAISTIR